MASLLILGIFPLCLSSFAQTAFVHTTREDFESGILQRVDTTSTPGDVRLALKPKAFWWDEGYLGRFQIGIENNEEKELPKGYTIGLSFDHASLVLGERSLKNGNDVRVVYSPMGEKPLELDRILEDGSSWNNSTTSILFKTQAPILGESADYYLYFGNPTAENPPSDPKKIFALFEGFEGYADHEKPNGWDKTDWAVDFEVSDEDSVSGEKSLKLSGIADNVAVYTHSFDLDYTVKLKFLAPDGNNGGIYFRSFDDDDPEFQKAPFNNRPYPHFIFAADLYQLNSGRAGGHFWDSCLPPQCPTPQGGEWNTFQVKVVGKKVLEATANGTAIWWKNQSLPVEFPSEKGTRVGIVYPGQPIFYDDFCLKLAVENEPNVTLVEEVDEYEAEGTLESAPFEAERQVTWGKIGWEATIPLGTNLFFQLSTSVDGETWSEWSETIRVSGSDLAFLPKSRFIKYKATLTTTSPLVTPVLHEVRIEVANTPPQILSLKLISSDNPYAFRTSTLTTQVETFDEDGDSVTLSFVWYKDGKEILNAPDKNFLTGDYFAKGDEISVLVTPKDGVADGKSWQSGPVTIGNSPPSACELVSPEDGSFINVNPPTLTWRAASDSDLDTLMYLVELDNISDSSGTSFTPSLTLSEGKYFWRVKAKDGEEEGKWSEVYSFILDMTPPTTSFTQKPDNPTNKTTAEFKWEGDDNFTTRNELLYSARLKGKSWSDFSASTTAKLGDLTDGAYTFEVKAKDLAGNIEESALYSWIVDITPPALPSSFSAEAFDGRVELSWTQASASDLAGYNLYRSTQETYGFEKLNNSLLTSTSYTDTLVNNGTKYYYKITSVDKLGNESGFSLAVGVTPKAPITTTSTTTTTTFSSPTPIPTVSSVPPLATPSPFSSSVWTTPAAEVLGVKDQPGEQNLVEVKNTRPSFNWPQVLLKLLGAALAFTFVGASGYLAAQLKRS